MCGFTVAWLRRSHDSEGFQGVTKTMIRTTITIATTVATGLAAMLAAPLAAQETRVATKGHVPPAATIDQAEWLIGDWVGTGIEGERAAESWLPPSEGTMVGVFVQEQADGTIRFTEHMYMAEEDGSLVLKLKHFNPDLTGWEEKGDMVRFRLLSIEPCAAYFSGLTYRCDDKGNLVVAVRMKNEGAKVEELVFTFKRREVPASAIAYDCGGSTPEMNACLAGLLKKAEAQQARYLDAALSGVSDRPELVRKIRTSDAAFNAHRDAECDAVWENWKDGTIRNAMSLTCSITMTDQRTHDIWETWLTYMDSTEPDLPEPRATVR